MSCFAQIWPGSIVSVETIEAHVKPSSRVREPYMYIQTYDPRDSQNAILGYRDLAGGSLARCQEPRLCRRQGRKQRHPRQARTKRQ